MDSRSRGAAVTVRCRAEPSFSIMSSSTSTLCRAISSCGCTMVDRLGIKYLPISTPSKPTTLTSSGTRRLMSFNARITPIATMSLMANTAVVSDRVAKKFRAALYASSKEKRVST